MELSGLREEIKKDPAGQSGKPRHQAARIPSHSAIDSRTFHSIIYLLMQSYIKWWLSAYYIPGMDLDAGITTGNKVDIVSAFVGLTS